MFMRHFVYTLRSFFAKLFAIAFVVSWPIWVQADTFIPLSLNGNVSYNYGYVKSEDSESDNTGLSTSINMTGYFWQPWFITSNFGVTIGLTRAASAGGTESSSLATAGSVDMEVFPRSRFPFSFSFNRSDSRLDFTNELDIASTNHFTNTRIFMRQSYIGRRSLLADASWIHNENESRFDNSTSDSLNASLRTKKESHFFQAMSSYSTSETERSSLKPENFTATADYDYVPGTELGVNSSLGYINNKVTSSGSKSSNAVTQASSFFSWRPEHKPYTFSGGARISAANAESPTQNGQTNDFGLNMGMDYRFTTRLKANATASLGATDSDVGQTTRSSESLALNYNSDQFLIAGFNYSWNAVGSMSNSNSDIDGEKENNQSLSSSIGHRATRSFVLGRITSMSTGLSQSVNGTVNGDNQTSYGLNHSANVGFNFRGTSGSTFVALNASDSRSTINNPDDEPDKDSSFQMLNAVISRNQLINRLSSMQANINSQLTRQSVSDTDTVTTQSYFASANYNHGRFFGIYALQFGSSLSYQRAVRDSEEPNDSMDWTNRFDYRVGLLDSSLMLRAVKSSGSDPILSLNFRATRSF